MSKGSKVRVDVTALELEQEFVPQLRIVLIDSIKVACKKGVLRLFLQKSPRSKQRLHITITIVRVNIH